MANRKGRKRILPADASFAARLHVVLRDREKRYREIRDRMIVIYLKIILQRDGGKMDLDLVPRAAGYFDVSKKNRLGRVGPDEGSTAAIVN